MTDAYHFKVQQKFTTRTPTHDITTLSIMFINVQSRPSSRVEKNCSSLDGAGWLGSESVYTSVPLNKKHTSAGLHTVWSPHLVELTNLIEEYGK